jgi:hypothetical protein
VTQPSDDADTERVVAGLERLPDGSGRDATVAGVAESDGAGPDRTGAREPEPGSPAQAVRPRLATLRRAPRYRSFIVTGAVLGFLLALLLVQLFPDDGRFSTNSVVGYVGVTFALIGGLIGGGVAVLLERPRRR